MSTPPTDEEVETRIAWLDSMKFEDTADMLSALLAERASLRADRERLDWLETKGEAPWRIDEQFEGILLDGSRISGEPTLRAAIDAAREGEK